MAKNSLRKIFRCMINVFFPFATGTFMLLLLLLIFPTRALGGGLLIDHVTFDQSPGKTVFEAGKEIRMRFDYRWEFSYGGKQHAYVLFLLKKVESAQPCGSFQFPEGKQIAKSQLSYLLAPMIKGEPFGSSGATFVLPDPDGNYELGYSVVPFFRNTRLPDVLLSGLVPKHSSGEIEKYFKKNPTHVFSVPVSAATFDKCLHLKTVKHGQIPPDGETITIYFKSGLKKKIDENILAKRALTFEWGVGHESSKLAKNVLYSYRLYPLQQEWSSFKNKNEVTYYLLYSGIYNFEVKSTFEILGQKQIGPTASMTVNVSEVIAAPVPLPPRRDLPSEFFQRSHYPQSRALLIGVTEYVDPAFTALPYVETDLREVGQVLRTHGFTIDKLDSATTGANIKAKMEAFLLNSQPDDRVILYFSGHGAVQNSQNYLVSSNCLLKENISSCISFDELKSWIGRMMHEKRVKHLLVVLDACAAGLGALSKSPDELMSPIEELEQHPSAHMITAGLLNQDAHIDAETGMSVFTQQFVSGLQGAADLMDDKVITLSELHSYLQPAVSNYVRHRFEGRKQIPYMGRIHAHGAGEMLFLLR